MLQQLVNAFVLGSVLLLFSLGLSLAWGTLDVLNLAHGALFIFGGYLGFELGRSTGLPFLAVLVVAMLGAGVAAALIEIVSFGPIRARMANKRQAELAILVASLGASIVLGRLIGYWTDDQIFAPSSDLFEVSRYDLGPVTVTNIEFLITGVAFAVALVMYLWVSRSRQGRAVRALAFSPSTASLMGINVRLLAVLTMFISGSLAGLAGLLLSFRISGQDVATGEVYMLAAFAVLIVGGVGSILGATILAYSLAIVQTAISAYGPASYSTGVAFALIFVFLLVRPQGLFGRAQTERV